MHFKHAISLLPLPNVKLFWQRITASRIAIIYVIFSVFNCTVQVVFQAHAFTINKQAADFLTRLIDTGNASLPGFFVLGPQLSYCDHVPKTLSTESCKVIWNGTNPETGKSRYALPGKNTTIKSHSPSITTSSTVAASSVQTTSPLPSPTAVTHGTNSVESLVVDVPPKSPDLNSFKTKRRLLPKPQVALAELQPVVSDGQIGVRLQGLPSVGNVTLNNNCLVTLNWPVQTLDNTKREDVAFLAFQLWVLGMSLVAVLNESIPHIIAAVLTHLSATAWGGFQIYSTDTFHDDFKRLTTNGVCQANLLPNYWTARGRAEILSLAFNITALLASCFLSLRLIKLFGWQTFKRMGASRTINRIYKLVLTLSVVIQLSLFFVVSAVALWLDQLTHGAIAVMATQSAVYQAFLMVVVVLLVPWLLTGWFAARKELKFPMAVFLVLSALYLVGWGLMFDSTTFRWTFVEWGFFGATASLSALLDLIGLTVGIMCRLNFDKGLVHYLSAEEPLRGDSFIQSDPSGEYPSDEKFDFPSTHHSIPTFSGTFGPNYEVPLPGQMRFQTGPRFFNQSAAPFDLRADTESVTKPTAAHLISTEKGTSDSAHPLTRNGSQNSASSQDSSIRQSRWVIE